MISFKNLYRYTFLVIFAVVFTACSSDVSSVVGQNEPLDAISASGFIESVEVSVIAEIGGLVSEVNAEQADEVTAGQVVVRLDDTLLQADLLQAQAAVVAAEANLSSLLADPTSEELASAQALVDQAQAGFDGAERLAGQAWSAAHNPQNINIEISAVQVEMAEYSRQMEAIQSKIEELEYELDLVEEDDDNHDPDRIENLNLSIDQLTAQLNSFTALYNGGLTQLDLLQKQYDWPLTLIAQAHQADSQVNISQAGLSIAQAQYDALIADPLPAEIAIAEAQIDLAQSQVSLVNAQIDQLYLISPIDGVVTARTISMGETVSPGIPLLTIANLTELKLIVYIPETQIGLVQVGAPVKITVDAYPARTFLGRVVNIAQEAEFTPRNVQTEEERVNLVFAVEIRIENEDGRLKPGMPADVEIDLNQ